MGTKKRNPDKRVPNVNYIKEKEEMQMYTEIDLKENRKMSEILKANKIKVRQENIRKNKLARRNLIIQSVLFLLVFIGAVLVVGFIENLTF